MKTLALILPLLLGGCASFDFAQGQVAAYGARAADETRQSAEYTLCHGITVGAWRRAYGADPMRAQGWALLCSPPASMPLPPVPAPALPQPGAAVWMS